MNPSSASLENQHQHGELTVFTLRKTARSPLRPFSPAFEELQ